MRALARCAIRAGEIALAVEVCRQALQVDPNDGLVYALYGEATFELGDEEEAIEHFLRATQL